MQIKRFIGLFIFNPLSVIQKKTQHIHPHFRFLGAYWFSFYTFIMKHSFMAEKIMPFKWNKLERQIVCTSLQNEIGSSSSSEIQCKSIVVICVVCMRVLKTWDVVQKKTHLLSDWLSLTHHQN